MVPEVIHGDDNIRRHMYEALKAFKMPKGVELTLPPPSSREIESVYIEYVAQESLTASVLIPPKFANAVGVLQGGFLAAMFDGVMGPLSLLAAGGPSTSLDLITYFLAPIIPGQRLSIVARVRKAGRAIQHITADAKNEKDALVATASSTIQVLTLPA
jgi:acyl-coenzyme A thioesterase PaaI-like protein